MQLAASKQIARAGGKAQRPSVYRRSVSVACTATSQSGRRQTLLALTGAAGIQLVSGAPAQAAPAAAGAAITQTLDAIYLAWNKGDIDVFTSKLARGATLEFSSFAPKTTYLGPEGLNEFAKFLFSKVEDSHVEVTERFVNSNTAIYLVKLTVTKSKKMGKVKSFNIAHYWTMKDGKVTAFREYSDGLALSNLLLS